MKCPVCNVELRLSERQGIEIDYCPQCRGLWLDRGEIDKIIERSYAQSAHGRPDDDRDRDDHYPHRRDEDYHMETSRSYDSRHRRKKRSFLEDIFDFG